VPLDLYVIFCNSGIGELHKYCHQTVVLLFQDCIFPHVTDYWLFENCIDWLNVLTVTLF